MADVDIEVRINGTSYRRTVPPPRLTLADFLRIDCGLTGTHLAANTECAARARCCSTARRFARAWCSRCRPTVPRSPPSRVSPNPTARCHRSRPRSAITTAPMRFLHTGFVVTASAFLRDNPSPPTDGEIREALSGNICRCTGYQGIISAVKAAAGSDTGGKG